MTIQPTKKTAAKLKRRRFGWILPMGMLVPASVLFIGITGHVQQTRAQKDFQKNTSQTIVEFVRIKPRESVYELVLPGNLMAVHQTTLNARATGYIGRWLVDIGDSVKEGELLAEIVTPDLDQELTQAQHTLQQAQANYELTQVNAQRGDQLVRRGVISKEENDTDQANYRAAAATVKADKASVDRLAALEQFKRVVAPFSGTITSRQIDVGTLVTADSASSGTPLYTIAATNPLNVFVNVPQSDAPSIHVGLKVKLLVEEYPTRDFEATVVRTAGALDPNSRTLNTEMQIENDDGALFAGMYAQLKFALTSHARPNVIPANAFAFRKEGSQVALLTNDNKIHWQDVKVGRDFGTELEVLSGVKEHDAIVVNPTDDLTEGLTVVARPIQDQK